MSVRMRSQDGIFGLANDVPAFCIIHEMMLHTLRERYPEITLGEYHHVADSFHVYERHFPMLERILSGGEYEAIECPRISGKYEVDFLRRGQFSWIPDEFEFTKWLVME
jgi:thymidylate synthase